MTTPSTAKNSRGADKKEAFHRDAESRMIPFKFAQPQGVEPGAKVTYWLCESDIVEGSIQCIPSGGDNNLHYHPGTDGFWMVLKGKCKFYGPDGVIGEYGPMEGILMPRNARYWFETGDPSQELHLLHISAKTQEKVQNSRVAVDPQKDNYEKTVHLGYQMNRFKNKAKK
jgi:hypothetical protein